MLLNALMEVPVSRPAWRAHPNGPAVHPTSHGRRWWVAGNCISRVHRQQNPKLRSLLALLERNSRSELVPLPGIPSRVLRMKIPSEISARRTTAAGLNAIRGFGRPNLDSQSNGALMRVSRPDRRDGSPRYSGAASNLRTPKSAPLKLAGPK